VFEEVDVELWPVQTPMGGFWSCDTSTCTLGAAVAAASHGVTLAQVADMTKTSEQTTQADAAAGGLSENSSNGNSLIGISGGVLTGAATKWGLSTCYQAGHASAKFMTTVTFTGDTTATAVATGGDTWSAATGTTLCRYDMSGFRAKITFKKNPGDINELTCDADLTTSLEHIDSADPSTDIVCTAQDRLNYELGAVSTLTGSTIGGGNGGQLTTNMNLNSMMTHGDRIHVQGRCSTTTATYCWVDGDCSGAETCDGADDGIAAATYTIAGPIVAPASNSAASTIIVEEETVADADGLAGFNTPASYWQGKGSTENVECSHRGLCNHDEGLCECFTGYTHDDCSMQDALNA
jgi:hypothetical protein